MIRKLLMVLVLGFLTCSTNAQLVNIPIPGSPLTLSVIANPQPLQQLNQNPAAMKVPLIDDNNFYVPLPFSFPYFGKNFNDSWMYQNGAISFQGPYAPGGFCCNGQQLNKTLQSGYNYAILPLWTDLIAASNNSSNYILGTKNSMTYGWYNINEYGTGNRNSFEVKIDNTGTVDMRYSGAFVSLNHDVTIGLVGNAQNGEYYQYYNGRGLQLNPTQLYVTDPCLMNPLYTPTCPGYQEAYILQQCSINPLYSPVCPGYSQAMMNNTVSSTNNTVGVISNPIVQNTITPAPLASTATNPATPVAQATSSQNTVIQSVVTTQPTTTVSTTTTTTTETKTDKAQSTVASVEKKATSATDAKRQVNEKAKEIANNMKSATTIEEQTTMQNTVIGLMGYTPGFSAYQNTIIPDIKQLEMNIKYGKNSVDNRSVFRQLNGVSDRKWSEIVESQYRLIK